MQIVGKYEKDSNFVTVYANNAMYTIARNTGDWGCLRVGEISATGHKFTQEQYDARCSQCTKEGTFELR